MADASKIMHWMQSKGLVTDLEIVDFPNMGKGLKSKKEFMEGSVFLRIPKELIITIESVKKELNANYDQITEIQALVLYLGAMKSNQLQGDWGDYLEAVPPTFNLPMMMDPKVLDFASWNLKKHVRKQLESFDNDIKSICNLGLAMPIEILQWAWYAVNTRCVTLQSRQEGYPTIALMPFLDFLNHSSSVSISSHYDQKSKKFQLSCKTKIVAESQAFLCYGPHDNTFLACEYGFVEENNIYDYVMLDPEMVYSIYPCVSAGFKDILCQSQISQEFYLHFEQVSYSLIMSTRLVVLITDQAFPFDELDLSVWYELVQGKRDIISLENESKVNKMILEIIQEVKLRIERNLDGLQRLSKDCHGISEQIILLEKLSLQELQIVDSIINLP